MPPVNANSLENIQTPVHDYRAVSLDFPDLKPVEVSVTVGRVTYVLREASYAVKKQYRNAQMRAVRMVDGKMTGLDGAMEADPLLLAGCLFETDNEGKATNRTVDVRLLHSWPARVVEPLVAEAKRLSNIDQDETREALEKRLEETKKALAKLDEKNGKAEDNPGDSYSKKPLVDGTANSSFPMS
jgi:hypothetical protein